MVQAILFEANKISPNFVWVDFTEEACGRYQANIEKHVGGLIQPFVMCINPVRNRQFGYEMNILYLHGFEDSGKPRNGNLQIVVNTCKKRPGAALDQYAIPFCGNVLLVKQMEEIEADPSPYESMDTADFRNAVDYLPIFGARGNYLDWNWAPRARKLKGVRVQGLHGSEALTFTATSYPQDYPFVEEKSWSADKDLGLELRFHAISVKDHLKTDPDAPGANIQRETVVFRSLFTISNIMEMDEKHEIQLDIHIVRRDGKDLLPVHMDAIHGFCQDLSLARVADYISGESQIGGSRPDFTKEGLEKYWQEYKTASGCNELKLVPSPYQM